MRYSFIRAHSQQFRIKSMCRVLQVSRHAYYAWIEANPARQAREAALLERIEGLHQARRGAYGADKTWRELNRQEMACAKHQVARIRKQGGIEARRKQRFRRVTEHHYTAPPAPDLLQRRFQASQPDEVWVGDFTYIRTRRGWLFLAALLDLYSRKVVGWSMGDTPNLELTMAALDMALLHRRPAPGLIHHSDQGAQYTAGQYREALKGHALQASMSAKGWPHDNAVAESFFSNLKNELVHHVVFDSREHARAAIFDYIEVFYNRQRIHQTLDFVSPNEFEQRLALA
jgi:transposase InsO family protein